MIRTPGARYLVPSDVLHVPRKDPSLRYLTVCCVEVSFKRYETIWLRRSFHAAWWLLLTLSLFASTSQWGRILLVLGVLCCLITCLSHNTGSKSRRRREISHSSTGTSRYINVKKAGGNIKINNFSILNNSLQVTSILNNLLQVLFNSHYLSHSSVL